MKGRQQMPPDNQDPLRICLLSYRSNPHCGGQGVYLKNLSRALKDLGHHVEVLSGPPDPQLDADIICHRLPYLDLYNPDDLFRMPSVKELCDPVNFLEWAGISTMGFTEPFTFGLRAYRFLKDRFHCYDIVHDNQCLSYGLLAIKRLVPTTVTIHHPITVDRRLAIQSAPTLWKRLQARRWYSFVGMQKRVAQRLSPLITVSECARKDIAQEFRLPVENLRVVPNGIKTDLFYPMPDIEREKNLIIVTNSADTALKGLSYLLQAVAELTKTRDLRLLVVGQPHKNGGVARLIGELGIGSLVTFTGRVDHGVFVRLYARATMAVVPSLYEGFGIPAGEAMACGVPVISTTGGALPEVVGDAGVLVPPADAKALAQAIKELLDHPARARQLGQAGLKRVRASFTWQKAAEKIVEVYREAIRDHRRS
jgi:glycosyltransferase involved in cell wall biosynthesis